MSERPLTDPPPVAAQANLQKQLISAERAQDCGNYRLARQLIKEIETKLQGSSNGEVNHSKAIKEDLELIKNRMSPEPLHLLFLFFAGLFLLTLTLAAYLHHI